MEESHVRHHVEDVGRILRDLEGKLHVLRREAGDDRLEEIVKSAQEDLREKAELIFSGKVKAEVNQESGNCVLNQKSNRRRQSPRTSQERLPKLNKCTKPLHKVNIVKRRQEFREKGSIWVETKTIPLRSPNELRELRRHPIQPALENPKEQISQHAEFLTQFLEPKPEKKNGTTEALGKSISKIRKYEEDARDNGVDVFTIRDGEVEFSNEYSQFKMRHSKEWNSIEPILEVLKEKLAVFSVPLAFVDGAQLSKIATMENGNEARTIDQLMGCISNQEQVNQALKQPGRRFARRNLVSMYYAATAIQANFRGMNHRRKDAELKKQNALSRLIQGFLRSRLVQRQARQKIEERRVKRELEFSALQTQFFEKWTNIRNYRHVIVHVPSLSFHENHRLTFENFEVVQNLQLSRLCNLKDPHVEVVYVAPFALPDHILGYFKNLLMMRGIGNLQSRLTFVVPENAHRFPGHFSLTKLLLYSPKAVQRLRRLTAGRNAFIIPGRVGREEAQLATALSLPILGPTAQQCEEFCTKSGAKKIFAEAQLNVPCGIYNVQAMEVPAMLARLIMANLDTSVWLLKINDEIGARGFATFNAKKIPEIRHLQKERDERSEENSLGNSFWDRADVQNQAREKLERVLRRVLPRNLIICAPEVYKTFRDYMAAFAQSGGVIEAIPQTVVANVTVNAFIEPDGAIKLLGSNEQVFSRHNPFRRIGNIFPQKKVSHSALRAVSMAVSRVLVSKGVIGSVSISLMAFMDPTAQAMRIVATDLDLHRTNCAAESDFFDFLIGGKFDESIGRYLSPQKQERSFLSLSQVHHPGMQSMPFAQFFNGCRMHGITFDTKHTEGTVFLLGDNLNSGIFGVLCISENEEKQKRDIRRALSFVHTFAGPYVQKTVHHAMPTFSDAFASFKRNF